MANQVKLLKIGTDGVPLEMDSALDEATMLSFTVTGGGPVLSGTGLDLSAQAIVDSGNISFNDPAVDQINGIIVDKYMAISKKNVMEATGAVQFPVITDVAGEVEGFKVPALAGVPTAVPAAGGAGYLLINTLNKHLYMYNGSIWDDLSTVSSANAIDETYTGGELIGAVKGVYLSANDTVSLADATALAKSKLLGFAVSGIASAGQGDVRKFGVLPGFTGLVAGTRYYLTTAGAIGTAWPVGAGNVIVQAGYAKNATNLDIQIQSLGRLAV